MRGKRAEGATEGDAIGDAELSLAAAQRSGSAGQVADIALDLGTRYWRLGDLDTAAQRVELALEALEQAGLGHRLGRAYLQHAKLLIQRDRASQALAALGQAAGYPDLGPAERTQLLEVASFALVFLVDFPTGANFLFEQAWPQALATADPQVIVDIAAGCVGASYELALWARGILTHNLLGVGEKAPHDSDHYVREAWRFIGECESRLDHVSAFVRARALQHKAAVVALDDGFDASLPVFAEARRLATAPRLAMIIEYSIGCTAARAGRWQRARECFLRVRSHEAGGGELLRRLLAWEMSRVEQALGRPEAALAEAREFESLQAKRSKLAAEWFADAPNRNRYGSSFDLKKVREAMLGRPLPAALARATQFVDANLGNGLTPASIALAVGVGKRTLQSLFRDHLGLAISDFIRERRMRRADEALRGGHARIAEVVESIGYSSAANFSRDYRKRFGRSPSSTRRDANSVARGLPAA